MILYNFTENDTTLAFVQLLINPKALPSSRGISATPNYPCLVDWPMCPFRLPILPIFDGISTALPIQPRDVFIYSCFGLITR